MTTTEPSISLVIPGRNCARTLRKCLESVVSHRESGELCEIIFVDDGSTDDSAEIAAQYPVRIVNGKGEGPGSARNLGWRSAHTELVWFIDSDCVAETGALKYLLPHLSGADVAGVGGSYGNFIPDSLLATLIHEEIVARHRRMGPDVNFMATFNVIYRRDVLEATGGFNESLKLAQDAELGFRIREMGLRIRFEINSRVGHHHPTRIMKYLKTQMMQGFFRVHLYRRHPGRVKGDSYAGLTDFLQPPIAMLMIPAVALVSMPPWHFIPFGLLVLLLILQVPMTVAMLRRTKRPAMLAFIVVSSIRAFARGIGMTAAVPGALLHRIPKADQALASRNPIGRDEPARW